MDNLEDLVNDLSTTKGHSITLHWNRYHPKWTCVVGVIVQHSGGESIVYGKAINNDLETAMREAEQKAYDTIKRANDNE